MVATLLRLLLVASLILDGSGAAMATPRVLDAGAVHSVAAQGAMHGTTPARPPCHLSMDLPAAHSNATVRVDMPADGDPHRPGDPDSACCGSGACQCACLQQAMTTVLQFETSLLRAADPQARPVPAHAPPLLSDPMRPPIG